MKSKILSLILIVGIVISNAVVALAEESYFQGSGTPEAPYLLSEASDLTKLAELTNSSATAGDYASKNYQLNADIDMSGVQYIPISYATNMYTAQGAAFTGTLDGNGHVIKNITYKTVSTYGATYGIIGYLGANGTVKNLGVEDVTINAGTASRFCIGGIAGTLNSNVTIEGCYVRGMTVIATPSGTDKTTYVGGISGRTVGNAGLIKNCYTAAVSYSGVTNKNNCAGILGSSGNTGYKAENCYTTDTKTQGYTSATNSYMGATNCYALAAMESATAESLGNAFKYNPTVKNEGYPLLSWESTEGYELKEEEKEKEDPYFKGKGTEEEPFEIDSPEKLVQLASLTNDASGVKYASKFYILTADIDLTGIQYKPVSYATNMSTAQAAPFTGTFDGNGHVIKNITFASIATYGATYGIIGYLGANGTVKNLGVENMTVNGGNNASRLCIGGIAGSINSNVTIEGCYVRGMTVTAAPSGTDKTTYVGGISGRTLGSSGLIKNSYATNLNFDGVTNKNTTAGLLGSSGNTGYKAENCYTTYSKTQGNTSVTNSYMSCVNCHAGDVVLLLTHDVLGSAFDEDADLLNEGMPILVWEYDIAHPETVYYKIKSGEKEITNGAKAVSVKNPVVIEFEKEMNSETFSKIKIFEKGEEINDFVFEAEGKSLTVKIDAEYNTEYKIIIPKTVQSLKDENGKSGKADEKTITWRTEAMPKAVSVNSVKINGEAEMPENILPGETIRVEVEVENAGELISQPVALIVTVYGNDGIMKYASLDTSDIKATEEILAVEFVVPENAGENPILNIMVWDSIKTMNVMK